VARQNLERAGLTSKVEMRQGPAATSLEQLHAEGAAPFDMIFVDADKRNNPVYLEWSLRLSRPGSLIVVDNVVRDGAVIDAQSEDPDIQGIRRFFEMLAKEPRLSATAIQTVGSKGYDGFVLALVVG
jgi:predicted O-methyltransferase YrrM